MKKSIFLLILSILVVFSACGSDKQENNNESSAEPITIEEITNPKGSVIGTVTANEAEAYEIGTSSQAYIESAKTIYASVSRSYEKTKKGKKTTTEKSETVKAGKTTSKPYTVRVNYKSIADLKSKAAKYKTLDDVLKSGKITNNADCINPMKMESLNMIFEDKTIYIPKLDSSYKINEIYLSSKNFFNYSFKDKKGKAQSLKIYVTLDTSDLKPASFDLAFKSAQGTEIYKNSENKYCWFLDDKYVVVYSGSDKNFIDNLYFERFYI